MSDAADSKSNSAEALPRQTLSVGNGNAERQVIIRTHSAPEAPVDHFLHLPKSHHLFVSANGKWKGVVTNQHALHDPLLRHVIRPHGRIEGYHGDDWHHKLNRFLHDHRTQTALNILLLVDVILIIVGIQIEIAFLETEIHDLEEACDHRPVPLECPSRPGDESLEVAFEDVEYASLAILCLFAADNMLLLIANGWEFFKNPFYVLDMFVVFLAIIFETVLSRALAGAIVVVVRFWRFLRIGHGVFETTHHSVEEKLEKKFKEERGDGQKGASANTTAGAKKHRESLPKRKLTG